jgi:tetratricopeptide (TPR) repeat protein
VSLSRLASRSSTVFKTFTCTVSLSDVFEGSHSRETDFRSNDPAPQAAPTTAIRCESVLLSTVSTYTDRPGLSKELKEKLTKTQGTGLAHAVAVTGLGGTGKTQLVLHYIEKHKAEYDTILWIDVRTKGTAQSSYERCCRELGLQVETATDDRPLQDVPYVQAVLAWLRAQSDEMKWLTILDNADEVSWESIIVPKGKAGTVIVTSQDAYAARQLLGGRSPTVRVDAMTSEEAMSLMTNHFDEPVCSGTATWSLVEEITRFLDRLALPLDLAGAQISVDVDNWGDLDAALRQYLSEYRQNQDKLLQDAEFAAAGSYNKTIWTAWETSLSSLRKVEDSQSGIYPIKLLSFLTLFDRTNVQDQLFRQASLGLDEACQVLETGVPPWLRELLAKGDDGRWDSSSHRNTVNALLRYGLVKPIGEPWKGVTMHGLVQRRARQELPHGYWPWYMVFLVAICRRINRRLDGSAGLRFRRHLVLHFPTNDQLLRGQLDGQSEEQLAEIGHVIGSIYLEEGRCEEAAQLQSNALALWNRMRGENDLRTTTAMSNLALTFIRQRLWEKANDLLSRVIQQREIQLGAKHPLTLMSRHYRAVGAYEEGRLDDAVTENLAVLEIRSEILGDDHHDTIDSITNLAATCLRQGNWDKAQELQLQVLEVQKKSLDQYDPYLLASMGNLAFTYAKLGKYGEAEQLQIEVLERFSTVLGRNHLETLKSMHHLGETYISLAKHQEAEMLLVEVVETRSRVLGPEHSDTLHAMISLTATLIYQERWKGAEELGVKTREVSSRVLGQNHPTTLGAMQNLALALKGLSQDDRAIDLMRRTAAISATVMEQDHPDCKSRRETAAEWSAIRDNGVEEVDGGSHEETKSM